MVLIAHILIAIASLLLSVYLLARPSRTLLAPLYASVALTLGSGLLLVVLGASWTHMCASSFVYTVIVAVNATIAKRRLLAVEMARR